MLDERVQTLLPPRLRARGHGREDVEVVAVGGGGDEAVSEAGLQRVAEPAEFGVRVDHAKARWGGIAGRLIKKEGVTSNFSELNICSLSKK